MRAVLFLITPEDVPYLSYLKPLFSGKVRIALSTATPVIVHQAKMMMMEKNCDAVVTCNEQFLQVLLGNPQKRASLNDYAGSLINKGGVDYLLVNPVEQLVTTSTGSFLYRRYFDKLIQASRFVNLPEFRWSLFSTAEYETYLDFYADCKYIAYDIETGFEDDRVITCISFTGIKFKDKQVEQFTLCIPFNDTFQVAVAAAILALPVMKVTQNGKYDNAYLLRYGICAHSWYGDTANLFHSWYAELPKRLDFIATFILREWEFWKDESKTTDIMDYYAYNAKDSFATAFIWLGLLQEVPDWAWKNYSLEFPVVYPCLLAEMTGFKYDDVQGSKELARFEQRCEQRLQKIRMMVGNEYYNPSSPPQTARLFAILGSGDIQSSGKSQVDKVRSRHPLNDRILGEIKAYREDRKLVTSYLRRVDPKTGRDKIWHNRIFYTISPDATDTGRLASRRSAFWCGYQIQNIPRDRDDVQIKAAFVADEGFYLGEADRSQAETWGTAYLSGDPALVAAVEDRSKDFHGRNASSFFGVPYSLIVESREVLDEEGNFLEWVHKTLDKALRDLSKRTNHGANYNMGPDVLLDTMGIKNVIRAQKLLSLPSHWKLRDVCKYLLAQFDKTYPVVRGKFQQDIKDTIQATKMLTGPTGWTRYCFGNPSKSKLDLNAYVAHKPQSLNAMELNISYVRVFKEIALLNPKDFRLGPQIHDSIVFQYKKGRVDLAWRVEACMHNPIEVTDIFGVSRTLDIPIDLKGQGTRWSELETLDRRKVYA